MISVRLTPPLPSQATSATLAVAERRSITLPAREPTNRASRRPGRNGRLGSDPWDRAGGGTLLFLETQRVPTPAWACGVLRVLLPVTRGPVRSGDRAQASVTGRVRKRVQSEQNWNRNTFTQQSSSCEYPLPQPCCSGEPRGVDGNIHTNWLAFPAQSTRDKRVLTTSQRVSPPGVSSIPKHLRSCLVSRGELLPVFS